MVGKTEEILPNINEFLLKINLSRYGKKYYQIPNDSISQKIRPKILSDGESDYYWRSDPELSNLDATTPITLTLKEYLKYHANLKLD